MLELFSTAIRWKIQVAQRSYMHRLSDRKLLSFFSLLALLVASADYAFAVDISEPLTSGALAKEWTKVLGAGGNAEITADGLLLESDVRGPAYVSRDNAIAGSDEHPLCVSVTMQVPAGGEPATGLHLYWDADNQVCMQATGDRHLSCCFRSGGNNDEVLDTYILKDVGKPYMARCSFRIVLFSRAVVLYTSVDGQRWFRVADAERRGVLAQKAPAKIIAGRAWQRNPSGAPPDGTPPGAKGAHPLPLLLRDFSITDSVPSAAIPALQITKQTTLEQTAAVIDQAGIPAKWALLGPLADVDMGKKGVYAPDTSDDWGVPLKDPNGQPIKAPANPVWTRPENDTDFYVDLPDLFGRSPNTLLWAKADLNWPADGEALLWFDSAEPLTIYVNNRAVFNEHERPYGRNRAIRDARCVSVALKKGNNVIKVRSHQTKSDSGFFLRVERDDPAYRIGQLEALLEQFPEAAESPAARLARLEIIQRYESVLNFKQAIAACDRAIIAFGLDEGARLEAFNAKLRILETLRDREGMIRAADTFIALQPGAAGTARALWAAVRGEVLTGKIDAAQARVKRTTAAASPDLIAQALRSLAAALDDAGERVRRLEALDELASNQAVDNDERIRAGLELSMERFGAEWRKLSAGQKADGEGVAAFSRAASRVLTLLPGAKNPMAAALAAEAEANLKAGQQERALGGYWGALLLSLCASDSDSGAYLAFSRAYKFNIPEGEDKNKKFEDPALYKRELLKGIPAQIGDPAWAGKWRYVGFNFAANANPDDVYGPEKHSEAGADFGNGKKWTELDIAAEAEGRPNTYNTDAGVDIFKDNKKPGVDIAFVARDFETNEAQDTFLQLTPAGPWKAWLDDKAVGEDTVTHYRLERVRLPIHLEKGKHRLMLRLEPSAGGSFVFRARISRESEIAIELLAQAMLMRQYPAQLQNTVWNASASLFGFTDGKTPAQVWTTLGLTYSQLYYIPPQNSFDMWFRTAERLKQNGDMGRMATVLSNGLRMLSGRGEFIGKPGVFWEFSARLSDALASDGKAWASDNVLREACARYPLLLSRDIYGSALYDRAQMRRDLGLLTTAVPLFDRALREGYPVGGYQQQSIDGLNWARNQKTERLLFEASRELQGLLEAARRQLSSETPDDVERAMRNIADTLQTAAGAMVIVDNSPVAAHLVGAREYIRAMLAVLPENTREVYRNAVASASGAHLRAALPLNDPARLEAVADEFYYTPAAQAARNRAGNLYFDRGQYSQAASMFQMLLREPRLPDGPPPAMLLGKLAISMLHIGELQAAAAALDQLGSTYATEKVSLGGQSLEGAALAQTLRKRFPQNNAAEQKPDDVDASGTTYLSNVRRSGPRGGPSPEPGGVAWARPLVPTPDVSGAGSVELCDILSHPPTYPLCEGNRVYVAALNSVSAYDLGSGKKLWSNSWGLGGVPLRTYYFNGYPSTCPTIVNGNLFVRVLESGVFSYRCYSCATGKLRWTTESVPELKGAVWLCDPAVAYGLAYGVFLMSAGDMNQHGVAAIDMETGRLRWKTNLATGQTGLTSKAGSSWGREGFNLATLHLGPPAVDGGEVYAYTGLTSIAALNAFSGDVRWLRSFPKLCFNEVRADGISSAGYDNRMREASAFCGGPLSPLVAPETILLAPKDGSGLLAFDRQSGVLRWQKDVMNCRYIAGMIGNNALVCEDNVMAVNVDNGSTAWEYQPSAPLYGQPGYSGNVVYLPTEKELLRIDARTGLSLSSSPWDSRLGPLSNLVVSAERVVGVGNGCLAAFGPKGTLAAKLPEYEARELEAAGKLEAAADAYKAILPGCDPAEALGIVSAQIRILEKLGKRDAALEALTEFEKTAVDKLSAPGGMWKVNRDVFVNSVRKRLGQNIPDPASVPGDLTGVLGHAWQLPGDNAQLIYPTDGPRDRVFVRCADTLGCMRLSTAKEMMWQTYVGTDAAEITVGPTALAMHSSQKISIFDRDTGYPLASINTPDVAKRGRKPVKAGNFGHTALDESRVFALVGNWLYAWDLRSGQLTWKRDLSRNVTAAQGLAVAGGAVMCIYRCREEGNFINWFDAKNGEQIKQPLNIGGQGDNMELCFSPDRRKLAFRGNAEFTCVDMVNRAILWKNPIPRLDTRSARHKSIRFESDVITYSGMNHRENDKWTIHWWDPETGKELHPSVNKGSITKLGSDYLALYTDNNNYRLVREDAKGNEVARIQLQESTFNGLSLQKVFRDEERVYMLMVRHNQQDQFVLWSITWPQKGNLANSMTIVDQQNLPGTASRLDWYAFDIQTVQYANLLAYNAREGVFALSMQGETVLDAAEKRRVELRSGGLSAERTVDARCALYSFEHPALRALEAPLNLRMDANPADWAAEPALLQGPIDFVPIAPGAKWTGAGDLSARVFTGWNRDGVVVAADVTDDVLVSPTPGLEATTGDSIRLVLCSRAPGIYRPDQNEMVVATLAWANGQSMLCCEHPLTREVTLQGHVSRLPGEKGYRYQIFVPWALLRKDPAQRPGEQLGLNIGLSVYDDDGAGVKGALELGACISAPHFAPDMLANMELLDISHEKIERYRKVIGMIPDSDEAYRFLELIMLSKSGPKADEENIAELEGFVRAHPASPIAVRVAGKLRILYGRTADIKAVKTRLETLLRDAKVPAASQQAIEGAAFHIWIHPDVKDPPRSLVLAFQNWDGYSKRCYWGAVRNDGRERGGERIYMGPLPAQGQWTELIVHGVDIGFQEQNIRYLSLQTFGGNMYFDRISMTQGGKDQLLMGDKLPEKWKVDHNPIRFVNEPKRDQLKPFTFDRNQQNAVVLDPLLSNSDKSPLFSFATDAQKPAPAAYSADVLRKVALTIADTPDGLRMLQRVLDSESGQAAVDELRSFLQANNGTPNDLALLKLLFEYDSKVSDAPSALSHCTALMVDLKISRDVRRAFYSLYAPTWSEWNVIGPFVATGERRGMDNMMGPEAGVDLTATIKPGTALNAKPLSWQKISNKQTKDKKNNNEAFVDLRRHTGMAAAKNEAHFAYAYYKFPVTNARKVYMLFGGKEAVSIWVNHKLVVEDRETQPRQDAESVEIQLQRGENEVLIKVASREALGFIFRLAESDGKPLEDVKNQ
jgi:outer membrane protein assembly factor BamB